MNTASRSARRRSRLTSLLRPVLLSTALLDELVTGFPVVALPLIRDDFGLSYEQVGLIFTVGSVSALLIEPIVNLLSDRRSKRTPVLLGSLLLALGFAAAAEAPAYLWLLLAFALIYPADGAAVGLSQAALIDQSVDDAPRTMARWTLMSGIGDLLAPLVVAAVVAIGFGWRSLFWLAALLWLGLALLVRLQRFPTPLAPAADQPGQQSLLGSLWEGLRNRALLRWAVILLFPTMLDEVFLGFAGLLLSDLIGAAPEQVSLALGAQMVGAIVGLVALERLLGRFRPAALLRFLACITLAGIVVLIFSRSILPAAAGLFVIGMGSAGWYPIMQAEAYAAMPGRSGTVRTVNHVIEAPFEIALPLLIGLISGGLGILAGVAALGLAPLAVLLLMPRDSRR